jgi:hypothetical protein
MKAEMKFANSYKLLKTANHRLTNYCSDHTLWPCKLWKYREKKAGIIGYSE